MKTWSKKSWREHLLSTPAEMSFGVMELPARETVYGRSSWQRGRRKISSLVAQRIYEGNDWLCLYCGAAAESIDHILPVTRGGTNEESNLAACCNDCNTRKGNMTVIEWLCRNLAVAGPGMFWNGGKQ